MSGKSSSSLHTRRRFLNRSGLLAASAPFMSVAAQAAAMPFTDIVDCHIHLWARDKKRFPYQPNPRYSPDYASTADQWETDRKGAGISMGIFVSGAPYGDDPSFLYHSLELAPESLRGVCLVNPNLPESPRMLEKTVKGHNIVGVRLQTDWLWRVEWGSPSLDSFWEKAGELEIVIQIHLDPEFNAELERMVNKYTGTRVVIDHLGRPRNGTAVDYMRLVDIAACPNVYMKLSAFQTESQESPPHAKLRPLIKELVRWFTPRRCVWGGNLYRGGMGSDAYAALVRKALWLLDFLSVEEQRQIFVENPRKLYKL
jgi:predicted TIM-barrel fold metal-dependent hydrolase